MKIRSLLVIATVLAGFLYVAPTQAAVRVYVRVPPPPLVVESPPPPPSPRHVWIGGYHRWDGTTYVWVPGRYDVPRRHYRTWVPGRWVQHRRGWYWVDGRWR